jgi:hypothetical protein
MPVGAELAQALLDVEQPGHLDVETVELEQRRLDQLDPLPTGQRLAGLSRYRTPSRSLLRFGRRRRR